MCQIPTLHSFDCDCSACLAVREMALTGNTLVRVEGSTPFIPQWGPSYSRTKRTGPGE